MNNKTFDLIKEKYKNINIKIHNFKLKIINKNNLKKDLIQKELDNKKYQEILNDLKNK